MSSSFEKMFGKIYKFLSFNVEKRLNEIQTFYCNLGFGVVK